MGFCIFVGILWIVAIVTVLLMRWYENRSNLKKLHIDSYSDGAERANYILECMRWSQMDNSPDTNTRYVSFRRNSCSPGDFDWAVKYISSTGYHPNGDTDNPYAEICTVIGNNMYKCRKENTDFKIGEIYKITLPDSDNQ